jgi:hypothetical protein
LTRPNSLDMRFAGEAGLQRIISTCLTQADAAVARYPTSSYAYYVRALANGAAGNFEKMNADLVSSQETGATEKWIAAQRVALSETHYDQLSSEALDVESRDIEMMFSSTGGLVGLSEVYLAQPDFRERLTTMLEEAPASVQQDFVKTLQWTMAQ